MKREIKHAYLIQRGLGVFNFFDELKSEFAIKEDVFAEFSIIDIAGKLLYLEGHKGLLSLGEERVCIKMKKGEIVIIGRGLSLAKLSQNTIAIKGKIEKVEKNCD